MNAHKPMPWAVVFISAIVLSEPVFAWTFGASSDWHGRDAVNGAGPNSAEETLILNDISQAGSEFAVISGDFFSGNWLKPDIKATYGIGPDGKYSLATLIDNCGQVCYGYLKDQFSSSGLPLIGTVGDHELGDNNWPKGSEKANAVTYYKQAFAKAFTLKPDGTSKYGGTIGGVPQRPVGTPYEGTSFAFIQHNILFVSVDIFRFDGANVELDSQTGVVSADLTAQHLQWLDNVLAAGRALPGIQFIVVSEHTPTILPVVLFTTSAQTTKNAENSGFWQLIRKHKVDVVLAGEVHSMTPSVDDVSGTVQLVHGYKRYSHSHLLFDVSDNKIVVRSREYVDGTYRSLFTSGTLTLDKTTGTRRLQSTGALQPIDRQGLLIHYKLDDPNLTTNIPNTGQFSKYYFGIPKGLASAPGIIGNAARLSADLPSYFAAPLVTGNLHLNPVIKEMPRTLACWVNTTSTGTGTLVALGGGYGQFTLRLSNGLPTVVADNSRSAQTTGATPVNDGRWHHVAATYPGNGATIDKIVFYIDGVPMETTAAIPTGRIATWPWGGITVGANDQKANRYTGLLDDCGVWSSALSPGMLAALHQAGRDSSIKFDAATMDKTFTAFRRKTTTTAAGKTWSFATGLAGSPGTITRYPSGDYVIVLTDEGEGVTTTAALPPANLLVNPGFETGSLSPWESWLGDNGRGGLRVVATNVRSGNWAGTVPAASGGVQRVAASSGVRYTVSAYGKVDVAHRAVVSYRFLDAAGKTISGGKDLTSFGTAYERRTASFITPPNTRAIEVIIWNGERGNLSVDDFALTSP